MIKRLWPLVIALAMVALVAWQYHNIRDWWVLRNYSPPPEIASFASSTTMTEHATREFYLARPELDTKQTFGQNCPVTELSLVLGCYNGSRIYILQVDKPELMRVMDVTAAHEMLHAAYADLSTKERQRVDGLLDEYYKTSASAKLKELVAQYEISQPGTKFNELHSLVGTQEVNIGQELEEYYKRYFNQRSAVVAYYLEYESVFDGLQDSLLSLESSIESLKSQIDSLEATLNQQAAELSQINAQLDAYEAADNVAAFNSLVPTQNSLVGSYNANLSRYKSLVAQHNAKVEQYNQLGIRQNDLVGSLDATQFTPQPAQ